MEWGGDTSTHTTRLYTVNNPPLAFQNYKTRLKIISEHFQMAFPKAETNMTNRTPVMAERAAELLQKEALRQISSSEIRVILLHS